MAERNAPDRLCHPGVDDGLVAGVDEAGRGPLAGPVSVAAVVLDDRRIPQGLDDSKKLSPAARERLRIEIEHSALCFSVVMIDAQQIDAMNILQATMHGMRESVMTLSRTPAEIVVDGNRAPDFPTLSPAPRVRTIVGGDGLHVSIAAASILAKCARDALMVAYDTTYPGYGFAQHKGYPTVAHRQALHALGPCPIHRRSFAPVRAAADNCGAQL